VVNLTPHAAASPRSIISYSGNRSTGEERVMGESERIKLGVAIHGWVDRAVSRHLSIFGGRSGWDYVIVQGENEGLVGRVRRRNTQKRKVQRPRNSKVIVCRSIRSRRVGQLRGEQADNLGNRMLGGPHIRILRKLQWRVAVGSGKFIVSKNLSKRKAHKTELRKKKQTTRTVVCRRGRYQGKMQ